LEAPEKGCVALWKLLKINRNHGIDSTGGAICIKGMAPMMGL
jgi:hypothetical protein